VSDDDFAMCPRDGYPRLFRFNLVDDKIVSILDPETNLLRINRYFYDRLPEYLQHEVLKTKARMLTIDGLI